MSRETKIDLALIVVGFCLLVFGLAACTSAVAPEPERVTVPPIQEDGYLQNVQPVTLVQA